MRLPWISRKWYEYEIAFYQEQLDRYAEMSSRSLKQSEEFLNQRFRDVTEIELLRAHANTMRGRLIAHGEDVSAFGPYFGKDGPILQTNIKDVFNAQPITETAD